MSLIQRSWHIKQFALAKIWYIAQVFLLRLKDAQKVESLIRYYMWNGHRIKINRQQLRLKYRKEGLNLVATKEKCDALLMRNIINQIKKDDVNEIFIRMLKEKKKLPKILRTRVEIINNNLEWLTGNPVTKVIYEKLLENYTPKIIETKNEYKWKKIWVNLENRNIPSDWKSSLYLIVNESLNMNEKLHKIKLNNTQLCNKYNKIDNIIHYLTECGRRKYIWNWVKNKLKELKVGIIDDDELIKLDITIKLKEKEHAILWLVSGISHNILQRNDDILLIERNLRSRRQELIKKYKNTFGIYLQKII